MAIDPLAKRFVDMANAAAARRQDAPTLAEMRAGLVQLAQMAPPPPVLIERREFHLQAKDRVIPCRAYSAARLDTAPAPGLIFFHGGGWVSGSLASHDPLCAHLAFESRCTIIAVDYRLAPEYPFPAGLDDCCEATSLLMARAERFGLDPARIGLAGDSAGAGLATLVGRHVMELGRPAALQLLLCPVLDALGKAPSRRDLASGYLIEEATMRRYFEFYCDGRISPEDARISPLRAESFVGLPRALIHTAEFDPLRDEGALYAQSLERAGVEVRFTMHSGMIHNFYSLGGAIPYAALALKQIGAEIRTAFGLEKGV